MGGTVYGVNAMYDADDANGANEENSLHKIKNGRAREFIRRAAWAIDGIINIMQGSNGIDGWHLNGDIALWDEFEEFIELQELRSEFKEFFPKEAE